MLEQDSVLAHRTCEKVEFLDRETPDFQACRGYEICHPYPYPQTPIVRTYSH